MPCVSFISCDVGLCSANVLVCELKSKKKKLEVSEFGKCFHMVEPIADCAVIVLGKIQRDGVSDGANVED